MKFQSYKYQVCNYRLFVPLLLLLFCLVEPFAAAFRCLDEMKVFSSLALVFWVLAFFLPVFGSLDCRLYSAAQLQSKAR